MNLTSLSYVLFLIVCVFTYWLLPVRFQRWLLLLSSVGFYLYVMPQQLPVMLVYLWIVYALSVGIARSKKRRARQFLIIGVCASVFFLFFYKYLNFVCTAFTGGRNVLSLVVPMGISYITFQCISYLVMAYRRQIRVLTNPAWFFLYALFFPKVTAGPIESPDRFFGELQRRRRLTWRNTLASSVLIAVGFVKKCAAADLIAPAVNAVFQAPGQADGLSTLIAVILYSAQIYFDFSGYTDIALGSARLFDIQLTENFNHPYAATSVVDFWRRWHISLSEWLKNFVYFPLGGSRVRPLRRYLNVMIVFLTSGLWHGASMTFVVWGLLHGLFQVLEISLGKLLPRRRQAGRIRLALSHVRTLALIATGWVFFRAETLSSAVQVLQSVFHRWAPPSAALMNLGLSAWVWLVFLLTAFGADRIKCYAASQRLTQRGGMLCCAALAALTLLAKILSAGNGAVNSFIYFNF